MRNDAADFFALFVLLSAIDKPTCRTSCVIVQFVPLERRREQTLTGERKRNAACVNGYPTSAPLLGTICSRTASTRGVKDEVAWFGRHQNAALDHTRRCLNYIKVLRVAARVVPNASSFDEWKIAEQLFVADCVSRAHNPTRFGEAV